MSPKPDTETTPIIIKKYANRRLYNTATSSYVTLDHLCRMVKDGEDFVVYDAKSGEDITRSVLTQIIVEEEGKGQNLLPTSFLRQLISLYGDNLQWLVPRYLDYSMDTFKQNQDRMRSYFQETMSGMFPFGSLEEVGKQNMAMFEQAMRVFNPFAPGTDETAREEGDGANAGTAGSESQSLKDLQKRLSELEQQLASLNRSEK